VVLALHDLILTAQSQNHSLSILNFTTATSNKHSQKQYHASYHQSKVTERCSTG